MFLPYNRNKKKLQAFPQPMRIFSVKFGASLLAVFNGYLRIDFHSNLYLEDAPMRTAGSD
jgi:hypothetical protein